MQPTCPLCESNSEFLHTHLARNYYRCLRCKSAFVDPDRYVSYDAEESRYLEHNNDVYDPAYRKFVKPILDIVFENFNAEHNGLDYGAGTGPVISKVLEENGYSIVQYDPFFCNKPEVLTRQYDYIVCCEVIEHFHQPYNEFVQLKSLLKPGGMLICMSDVFYDGIDFAKWYYKSDPTHVFFFHPTSLSFIKAEFGFSSYILNGRIVRFEA